jgi:hypothetical protein
VRKTLAERLRVGQAEHAEQLVGRDEGFAAAHPAVPDAGLDHLIAEPFRRVESGGRRLRYIGDAGATDFPDACWRELEDVLAVEDHLAAGDANATAAIGHCCQPNR